MPHTSYGHSQTKGAIIQIFYHGLDDPTQGFLDARGIFFYKTLNEAFKIYEDKVLLKLDFSSDSKNSPQLKTIVSTGGSNINVSHEILTEKLEALARKINSKFLLIGKELKEMRDGRRDNHDSQIYMSDDMTILTKEKEFEKDVLLNNVGDNELKLIDCFGTERMTKKKKDDNDIPKEPNKEWKLNEKAVPCKENVYHYL
ncbi:hypothetical protein Tco_0629080 [Tanacetum coccineum]|uniref:Uncharacterized protein n=1 Tax=Tanacetum coccineum TaxID=301880 RepID=A0ABQ4WSB9_9ASTR